MATTMLVKLRGSFRIRVFSGTDLKSKGLKSLSALDEVVTEAKIESTVLKSTGHTVKAVRFAPSSIKKNRVPTATSTNSKLTSTLKVRYTVLLNLFYSDDKF